MRAALMRPLHKQVHSLEGQLDITRDELAQKDAQLDALRWVAGGRAQRGHRRGSAGGLGLVLRCWGVLCSALGTAARSPPLACHAPPHAHAMHTAPLTPGPRERHEEQQASLRKLGAALAAAEEAAAAAATSSSSEAQAAAAEAASLRQRCQQVGQEAAAAQARLEAAQAERDRAAADQAHLRESLQQRDAEVAQLRRQVSGCGPQGGYPCWAKRARRFVEGEIAASASCLNKW